MVRQRAKGTKKGPKPEPAMPAPVTKPVTRSEAPATETQRRELTELLAKVEGMVDIEEYPQGLTLSDAQEVIVRVSYPKFRRVDDEWVVLGPADTMTTGKTTVNKKDGTSTHVHIKRLGEPFISMGVQMVHGYLK